MTIRACLNFLQKYFSASFEFLSGLFFFLSARSRYIPYKPENGLRKSLRKNDI